MNGSRRVRAATAPYMVIALLLGSIAGIAAAAAETAASRPPANALATETSYGRGWECRRGYREINETCIAIAVPKNAYLNSSGVRWECERGFREVDETCVAIDVPRNAYLTESNFGSGWKCERGFQVEGEACNPIDLPANAHLDYSGNDWECDRPYRQQKDGCILR